MEDSHPQREVRHGKETPSRQEISEKAGQEESACREKSGRQVRRES